MWERLTHSSIPANQRCHFMHSLATIYRIYADFVKKGDYLEKKEKQM